MHTTMLSQPGRWLLALPRTALINEQAAALAARSLSQCIGVAIEPVHSDQTDKRGKVGRRIEKALRDHAFTQRAILIITHEALLDLDPALLKGWNIAIDEVPEGGVLSGAFKAGTQWRNLADTYNLVPVADGSPWYRVVPRSGADLPTIGDVIHDEAKALVPFHKAVLSKERAVYVNVASWEDAKGTWRSVYWYSCWTPEGLVEHAASVTFAGAGILNSLEYHAAQQAPSGPIAFEQIDISAQAPRTAQPKIIIHYFVRHLGATTWWEADEGSRCLVAISRYLEAIGFDGYWSGNDMVRPYFRHRFPGVECQPKVAGTNSLRTHTRCAFFYSNKAQEADNPVMEVLGLGRDHIRRAREDEDILQFVCRGMLRDGTFGGVYEVHLYSEDQAERLKDYLIASGISDDVRLVGVDAAGIMEMKRPEPVAATRQHVQADPVTVQARAEKRRVMARERSKKNRDTKRAAKVANGTARGPGRPPKAGNTKVRKVHARRAA